MGCVISKKGKTRRVGRNRPTSTPSAQAEAGKASSAKVEDIATIASDQERATANAPASEESSPRWSRSEVLKGAAVTLVGGVLLGGVAWIVKQILDVPAAGDGVRRVVRDDIRYTVEVVYLDDEGRSKALPSVFQPDTALTALMAQPGSAAEPDLDRRLRAAGAVHVGALSLRLTLEGRLNQEIRILDIKPVLVEPRRAPLGGTLFYIPPQESDPVMNMTFDMDALSPVAHEVDEEGRVGKPFFEKKTISLPDAEQDTIIIRTFTKKYSLTFFFRMKYKVGDEIRHIDIYNQGKSFRLTAMNCDRKQMALYRRAFAIKGDFSLHAVPDPSALGCVAGYKQPSD